ncbi:PAS domain S-box protein [Halosimplex pelagicum]|uniref:PAS domain S-box protein n=1 Tax=Halosimplex pelagicum TaxID=869886 RepID=A0A7D5TBV1_9EURY|nr:PAS domain S-box protein [Halosimplex pelagicum]QLH82389.1 PAS domain S-box protein [Halosimplex pelagicum]
MSKTVENYTEILTEEGEDLFLTNGMPEVLIFDDSPIAGDLAGELEHISWNHRTVESEDEALTQLQNDGADCLVYDPNMLETPIEFLLDLRQQSDIPVVVWGNDIGGEDVRQIASVPNTDYVPKVTGESEKVFCLSSLNKHPHNTPFGPESSASSTDCDEVLVSIVYHSVREYWMNERIETQLDAIENSLNGIAILNDDREFVYTNETMVDLFGYDSAEILLGNSAQMCFPHHEIDRFSEDILPEAKSEGDWRGGIDCRKMDGSVFPARLSVSWLSDGQYVLTIEDISEQRVLQEELDEIHEHIGQAFIAVDDDLGIAHLNHTAQAYFDLPDQDTIVGETLFDSHFTEMEEELRDGFAEVDTNDEETSFSIYLDSRDSWLETRIYPFDGGYALYFRDITEQKERQRQLDLARNFIEESADGYFVIEADSAEIVDVNPTAHKWLGIGKHDLIGMSAVDMINNYSDVDGYTMENHYEFCEEARDGVAVHEAQYGPPAGTMYPVEARGTCETINGTEYLIVAGRNSQEQPHEAGKDANLGVAESFLEGSPDPVVLIDPEQNEVIEVNYRTLEVTGFSQEDLVGCPYRKLFPDEIVDEQLEKHDEVLNDGGGRYRRLPDGSYVRLRTEDGTIPVEISTTTVETATQTAHLNVIRIIEEAVDYEESFQLVNEMTHQLGRQESANEIAKTAVDAIENIPLFVGSGIYLYDESVGVLDMVAYNEPEEGAADGIQSFEPGDGGLWDVYSENETRVFNDNATIAPCTNSSGEVAVPIGSHGVLFACCADEVTTGGIVENFATVVASSIESALDRAESITELKERERKANIQKQQLEYVSELNDKIRSLNKALVQAESKEAIREAVCHRLAELDEFDGILFTEFDGGSDTVELNESTGVPEEFLDRLPLSDGSESLPPTSRTGAEQEVVEVSNIASKAQQERWANIALEHEFKSVISIPLEYDDISYGSLTIYSDLSEAFDGRTKDVLEELGSLVAYAFHAVTSRAALGSNSGIDMTFNIDDSGGLREFAADLDTALTVQNVIPANDDDYFLLHCHIANVDSEDVVSTVEGTQGVDDIRMIGEAESGIYELKIEEPGSVIKIVDLGVSFESAVVSPENIEVTVTLPTNRDRGEFIKEVESQLPTTAKLQASHEDIEPDTIPWARMLRGSLTEKQETALRTAYHVGYFDSPAKTNGRELAERIGISQGTISYRLRAAQRNLFGTMWDSSQQEPIAQPTSEN